MKKITKQNYILPDLFQKSERALLPSVFAHKEFVLVLGASSTETIQYKQRHHIIKVIKNTNNEENKQ